MVSSDLVTDKPYLFSEDQMKILIPKEYRRLLHSIAYCTKGDYQQLPEIDVELDYKDLQGIHYQQKLKLDAKVNVDLNADDTLNHVVYVLEQVD